MAEAHSMFEKANNIARNTGTNLISGNVLTARFVNSVKKKYSVTNVCTALHGYSFLFCVIGCHLEEPMGLTNLKFSFNHMRAREGAADRRFLTFFFQTWKKLRLRR